MSETEYKNYEHIEQAIEYLSRNFDGSVELPIMGQQVMLSPYHLVRLMREWSGMNPEEFVRYLRPTYRKKVTEKDESVFYSPQKNKKDSVRRYHDMFISIENRKENEELMISYDERSSPFGPLVIATTEKGICFLSFLNDKGTGKKLLQEKFPGAEITMKSNAIMENALKLFDIEAIEIDEIPLYIKGTDFQLEVWQYLLKVPFGGLTTYGKLANAMGNSEGARAVGNAIGKNPVGFLIPCHRVINADGTSGNFRWGETRKKAMIGWEAAKYQSKT